MTISDVDAEVFDKLREAGELYAGFLALAAAADRAALVELSTLGATDEVDVERAFHPLPLTIAFPTHP